ncbi:MAG: hypothetical protein KDB23_18865, partial [Planctomycetales bacterium]|nr:hypothetical protein [Planctomycetales bacterium]
MTSVHAESASWHSQPLRNFNEIAPFLGLRFASDNHASVPDASSRGWELLPPGDDVLEQRRTTAIPTAETRREHAAVVEQTITPIPAYSFDEPLEPEAAELPDARSADTNPSSIADSSLDDMPALPDFGFPDFEPEPAKPVVAVQRPAPANGRSADVRPEQAPATETPRRDDTSNDTAYGDATTSVSVPSAIAHPAVDLAPSAASDDPHVIINPMARGKQRQRPAQANAAAPQRPTQRVTMAPPAAADQRESAGDDNELEIVDPTDDWFNDELTSELPVPDYAERSTIRPSERPTPTTDDSILPLERDEPQPASLPPGPVQQAREYINEGIRQAQQGAIYSSRSQFIKVLRLVSQSLDAQIGSTRHADALAAGVRALEEAGDFRPSGSGLEGNLDLGRVIMAHRT